MREIMEILIPFLDSKLKSYYATLKKIRQDSIRNNVLLITYDLHVPNGLPCKETSELDSAENLTKVELKVQVELDSSKSIKTTIEYTNTARNGRLRVLYATGFETSISYAESQFNEVKHAMVSEQKFKDHPNRYEKITRRRTIVHNPSPS